MCLKRSIVDSGLYMWIASATGLLSYPGAEASVSAAPDDTAIYVIY